MDIFLTRLFSGMTAGSIYAMVALALVVVFRSSSTINFAQGEFALFTTYVSWWLTERGWNVWLTLIPAVILGFVMCAVAERFLIRPVRKKDETAVLIVALALFTGLNGLDGWIWGSADKVYPRLIPIHDDSFIGLAGARLYYDSLFVLVSLVVVVGTLGLLLNKTNLGLQMRAVATNPESAGLCGIKVGRVFMISWGIAGVIGSLAAAILIPVLPPGQLGLPGMFNILIFGTVAALLGGLDSVKGAVVGGFALGIGLAMINGYGSFFGGSISLTVALVVIVAVLGLKPNGLFGTRRLERV
jgi:branched-chain amino acid transport system permease protein